MDIYEKVDGCGKLNTVLYPATIDNVSRCYEIGGNNTICGIVFHFSMELQYPTNSNCICCFDSINDDSQNIKISIVSTTQKT